LLALLPLTLLAFNLVDQLVVALLNPLALLQGGRSRHWLLLLLRLLPEQLGQPR
jgi:hypothetical protein